MFHYKRFFQTRDELSLGNIRWKLWPLLLIFPLSVILGDFRYFDLNIKFAGLHSYELMLYPLGLGWLALAFVPSRFIIQLLRITAISFAVLIPFQLLLTDEIPKLAVFMAFQFLAGICAAAAFSLFCFKLNNVERLFGMVTIIFYYGFYYTIYRDFPVVQDAYKTWGGILVMAFYLVVVFLLSSKMKQRVLENAAAFSNDEVTDQADSKNSKVKIVISLHMVYYSIMCMINYIEWAEHIIYNFAYGLGQLSSMIVIILVMLISNRSALYIWLMFLVFSLFGLTVVNYNSEAMHFAGSLMYGLGDGLGYVIIYYLCSGAIKNSKSIKMYRFFCVILFIEYFFISGILSLVFDSHGGSNHTIALSVVLVLSSCCFLILPYLQKKFFEVDWTDGFYLKDMTEYTQGLAETELINKKENLDLTEREHEVFTLLLKGVSPKEIALMLKVSYHTVVFHRTNLYRKLGIQSIHELFSKYSFNNDQNNPI